VLSDPKKRKVYDQFGQYSDNLADAAARGATPGGAGRTSPGFDFSGFDWSTTTSTGGGGASGSSFRDIFADLFGGGAARNPSRREPNLSVARI
jgi:molecular chaperone DnaJ